MLYNICCFIKVKDSETR